MGFSKKDILKAQEHFSKTVKETRPQKTVYVDTLGRRLEKLAKKHNKKGDPYAKYR